MRIVLDEPERFGEFAKARIGHVTNWGEHQVIGLECDGKPIAAVVFNLYSGADIALHVAALPGKRWATRAYLRACFGYAFDQLKVRRVSAFVASANTARRFVEHLGFKREGLMRECLPDGDDIVVYGMLKRECRFL